jgi:diguanylate cyclase (GGDEF)-like protein/PAS domain S-box-containing protein
MNLVTLKSMVAPNPLVLGGEQTIAEALEVMAERSISSVVIVDDHHRPIGIFTERDALGVIAESIPRERKIAEVMSSEPFCVDESLYLHDAYRIMEEKKFRHLVVVNREKRFVGVVSEGDFLRHIGFDELGTLKRVEEAMSASPLILSPSLSLADAAAAMHERQCDYAVVLEDSHPKGVITEREITHWYAEHSGEDEVCVQRLVQSNFRLISRDISLQDAAVMMEEHGVHRLIVVDDHRTMLGLLSRHDVLHAINGAYFEYLIRVIDHKNETISEIDKEKKELYHAKEISDQNALKLRTLFEALPDLIWLKDREGIYLACNPMFERLYNAKESDIVGKSDFDFVDPELARFFRDNDNAAMRLNAPRHNEEFLAFADGSYAGFFDTIKTPMRDKEGNVIGILGIARDITERKKYEKQLEAMANYDTLTGLANRALLQAHLHTSIEKAKRDKTALALLMFDLDRFKDINDSYGHSAGDELLQAVAQRFTSRLREGDLISRLGGDEFAVVLESISRPEDAGRVAEEMMNALSAEYRLSGGALLHVGSSAGIVLFPEHASDPSTLLQYADAALYKAKSEGRGVYRYYTDELTESARKRIECETMLRRGVMHREFEVYYQPQVHIQTGRIVGAEALIRWNCPVRGWISPVEFIPVAEEIGLIGEIGEWVLNETCAQGKIWLDKGHRLTLAVNLSAHQLHHQDVLQMVEKTLKKTGYPAERLELELTESALMRREEETVAILHALRAHGIRLAIDDFGTGYSSLSYLKRFPIDVLKIDKSFVDDIPFEPDDMAIVSAIIAMGQALGFQVLAEGTERPEQIDFLREKGCTLYQGYFKSPPVAASEFEKLL